MGESIWPLLFALIAVGVVLYLSYVLSKFLANKVNHVSKSNNIKIIERVALTQDKGLAVVEIGHKYYLVGFSTNTIEILKDLDQEDLHFPQTQHKFDTSKFLDILNSQIKSRLDLKKSDKDNQKADHAQDGKDGEKEE